MTVRRSYIERRPERHALAVTLFGFALHLFGPGLRAQENCNGEVKLMLLPGEAQAAITALGARKAMAGRVYFFDTDALNLLSQGAMVRLRRGANNDLTVKLRLPSGKPFIAPSEVGDDFKCEIDLTGDGADVSYSAGSRYAKKQLPQTGHDVSILLSPTQIKLLNDAQVSVAWSSIKRIAEIKSTVWQTQVDPQFGKLMLELWEWDGGKILELSMKVPKDKGSSTYAELQQLAKTKGLTLSPIQRAKTRIVLDAITHATPH
jgi:hypothetical protein